MNHRQRPRSGILDGMINRQATDIALDTGSDVLVYLIHGITGTPTEMHYVARGLSRRGWDVYATTLPGHCTRLRDLMRTSEYDWRWHVQTQLAFARERYPIVFVAGLSAGALLALEAATAVAVDGVGVLSPTFVFDGWNTPWTHMLLPFGIKVLPRRLQQMFFQRDTAPFGIKDEALQARMRAAYSPLGSLRKRLQAWWTQSDQHAARPPSRVSNAAATGYPLFPLKTFADLDRLITRVRTCLSKVTTPTVILQAREDDVTSPRNGYLVYDEIGATEKQLVLLDDCYHVITVDKQKQAVVKHLVNFFATHMVDGVSHETMQVPTLPLSSSGKFMKQLVSREKIPTNGHGPVSAFSAAPDSEPEPV